MCYRGPSVTIYGKNNCNQCDMTVKLFDREGVSFTYINIEEDPDAFKFVTHTLGYKQAPAVVARFPGGSEETWSGFRVDRIKGYARASTKWSRNDS